MKHQDFTEEILQARETMTIAREMPSELKIVKRRIGFFTGEEQHDITLEEGSELTRNYRKSTAEDAVKGGYFGKEIFERILAQKGCVGIRIYYAMHTTGTPTFVLAGVETNGNDLFEGILGQEVRLSPPWSSNPNPLNCDTRSVTPRAVGQKKIFTGKENHYVTLAEASQLTRSYRESLKDGEAKGGYFGGGIFRKILAQAQCVGIRIYFGNHEDGSPTFVLVGVDAFGSDLLFGDIAQKAFPCPPWCAVPNPLNK